MAAPVAPSLRAVQGAGQGSVRVQLDSTTGAESYLLWRSTDAAFSDEAIVTADPEFRPNWYFDVTVLEGFTHWYRATALGVAVNILTSSIAAATVLTTDAPHGLTTGDKVVIAGHVGSTPAIDGRYTATVLSPTTFSIPVTVTVDGTGGTMTPESVKSAERHVSVSTDQGNSPTPALRYERSDR